MQEKYQEKFPFITGLKYGETEHFGIVVNYDNSIITFYDIQKINSIEETKALLDLLNYYKLSKIKQEFINISVRSNKWKKWTLKGSKLSDLDKTLLCGHYNFSKKNFKILKEDLNNFLKAKKRDLNHHLKTKIEINILKYLKNFRVINNV